MCRRRRESGRGRGEGGSPIAPPSARTSLAVVRTNLVRVTEIACPLCSLGTRLRRARARAIRDNEAVFVSGLCDIHDFAKPLSGTEEHHRSSLYDKNFGSA